MHLEAYANHVLHRGVLVLARDGVSQLVPDPLDGFVLPAEDHLHFAEVDRVFVDGPGVRDGMCGRVGVGEGRVVGDVIPDVGGEHQRHDVPGAQRDKE